MIREVTIVPSILVKTKQDFRAQVERVHVFTRRAQIDITDGVFAIAMTILVLEIAVPTITPLIKFIPVLQKKFLYCYY